MSTEDENVSIPFAVWPDNLPHEDEKYFIMVVASERQYRWAVFDRYMKDFHPCLYWRTSVLEKEDMENSSAFERFFPEQTKNLIYGTIPENQRHVTAATAFRSEQRIPSVTVFCLLHTAVPLPPGSVNPGTLEADNTASQLLYQMLQDSFPCNVYQLRASDFWPDSNTSGAICRTAEHLVTVAAIEATLPSRHCFLIDGGAATMTLTILAPTDAKSETESTAITAMEIDECNESKEPAVEDASVLLNRPSLAIPLETDTRHDTSKGTKPAVDSSTSNGTSGSGATNASTKSTPSIRIVVNNRTVSIERKLLDLHEKTGALPEVTSKQVLDSMTFLEESNCQLGMFATNTEDAMIGSVLREGILYVRAALKEWAETLEATENEIQHICSAITGGVRPTVFVTGNEGDILFRLLTEPALDLEVDPDFSWIDPPEKSSTMAKLLQIRQQSTGQNIVMELKQERYMVFHGISPVLRHLSDEFENSMTPDDVLRQEIRGRRVAKDFGALGIYFGHVSTVTSVNPATMLEDLFTVRYDDGDFEDYNIDEIYQLLQLSTSTVDDLDDSVKTASVMTKRNDSERVAKLIAARFPIAPSVPDPSDTLPPEEQPALESAAAVPNTNGTVLIPELSPNAKPVSHEDEQPTVDNENGPTVAGPIPTHDYHQQIMGCHVAKDFGPKNGGIYIGHVSGIVVVTEDQKGGEPSIDDLYYTVLYEDDDTEDFTIVELHAHMCLYCKHVDGYEAQERVAVEDKRNETHRVAAMLTSVSEKVQREVAKQSMKAPKPKTAAKTGSLTARKRRVASNGKRAYSSMD